MSQSFSPSACTSRSIAYFSMEIGLESGLPTYSGGLGVLAGDTIKSAADLAAPMVAITLLHRNGYFKQELTADEGQVEAPVEWNLKDFLIEESARAVVPIADREVALKCWRYDVKGHSGSLVPVYFLDADLEENSAEDRQLTDYLYGGDNSYRLQQEIILGIGGVRMLRALGFSDIEHFHLNEGHAALLTLQLLEEQLQSSGRTSVNAEDIEAVKQQCVFTTHTPVPAGHDRFSLSLLEQYLPKYKSMVNIEDPACLQLVQHATDNAVPSDSVNLDSAQLNMTHLALGLSRYVNGVAKKHAEVSREMFPGFDIDPITNGVHAGTWISSSFQELFDKHLPDWRSDNMELRNALAIPLEELEQAHQTSKKELFAEVKAQTGVDCDPKAFTLGFARRFTAYKRANLIFSDTKRLKAIVDEYGPLQFIIAGKAHPKDNQGKDLIREVLAQQKELEGVVTIAFLSNYDMRQGGLITAGVDVWLNNPEKPLEASGTSGMKSAMNGVPSLSVLDGWWIEGCIESVTGWAIGDDQIVESQADARSRDAEALYTKLGSEVMRTYYQDSEEFSRIRRQSIAINGPYFSTQRMVSDYMLKAYR